MSNICHDMENWAVQSPEEPGFHAVVTPDKRIREILIP